MLLTMDVGNTNIKIGLFNGEKLAASWRVSSRASRTGDEYGAIFTNLFHNSGYKTDVVGGIIISSVMPSLNYTLEHMCKFYFHNDPIMVESGIKTGINIRYDNPKELGADRIVNAVAASNLYQPALIVVDFGTATTFSVVNKNYEFVGGVIGPGIKLTADALVQNAAKLPKIELVKPDTVIGKSTVKNMQAGIVFGFAGMVDYILRRVKKELEGDVKVIATGGFSELISGEVPQIDIVDRTLTLQGLRMIYELNR